MANIRRNIFMSKTYLHPGRIARSFGVDSGMRWYRTSAALDDWFTPEEAQEQKRRAQRKQISERKVVEPYRMPLYRGMNLDISSLPETITLDPGRSEQGMIWFTHPHIRGYDPVEYAENHGTVVLTYPIDCTTYSVRIRYDDGSEEKVADPEKKALADPLSNCRYMASWDTVIELPEGFVFTYKMEKFVGCTIPLKVSRNMLRPVVRDDGR
jgi:hypothetical protein